MNALDLVNLRPLMAVTEGRPEIVVGLVDGPVVIDHPYLGVRSRLTTSETWGMVQPITVAPSIRVPAV